MSSWSTDIDCILDSIRINCTILSNEYKKRYMNLKLIIRYFKIPVIILSSCNSILSVGGTSFNVSQQMVSGIVCLVSLLCGIIGTIEVFLSIQKQMELDLESSKSFYLLSIEIFKIISLDPHNRGVDGKKYLTEIFDTYSKIFETSNLLEQKILDSLTPINEKHVFKNLQNQYFIENNNNLIENTISTVNNNPFDNKDVTVNNGLALNDSHCLTIISDDNKA